jgi:riboflavin synthase
MFTGLIEAVGEIAEVKTSPGGFRIRIRTTLAADLISGESLAVNGVCLTVVTTDGGEVHADIGPKRRA